MANAACFKLADKVALQEGVFSISRVAIAVKLNLAEGSVYNVHFFAGKKVLIGFIIISILRCKTTAQKICKFMI